MARPSTTPLLPVKSYCVYRWYLMAISTARKKARAVLAATGADALMVGVPAHGPPLDFSRHCHYLAGEHLAPPFGGLKCSVCWPTCTPITSSTARAPVRSARKHITWYVPLLGGEGFASTHQRHPMHLPNGRPLSDYFDVLAQHMHRLPCHARCRLRRPNKKEFAHERQRYQRARVRARKPAALL